MNRDDYIWVGIRLFGLFLLVMAVLRLPALVANAMMTVSMWDAFAARGAGGVTGDAADSLRELQSRLFAARFGALIESAVAFVAFTVVGAYLLRGGRFIFRLVSPPNESGGQAHPQEPDQRETDGTQGDHGS